MANSSLLSTTLCLLLLCHGSLAQRQSSLSQQQQTNAASKTSNPLEPARHFQHEAGVAEEWDQNNDQFECAGVVATRHLIEPRGLLLPSFEVKLLFAFSTLPQQNFIPKEQFDPHMDNVWFV